MTKIGRGNANYWIEAVAQGGDDYYTKPGEAPGEWIGTLAGDLGLQGQVGRNSYISILAGRDPTSGDQLLTRPEPRRYLDSAGRERVAEPVLGYDVRFAAPKSVSLLYGIGEPEVRAAIVAAHDEAVRAGISYLEEAACFVQRGRNGVRIEAGGGLIGMAFRHRMSRAGDPALHTHVVISNITRALGDGRWLTLASPKGRTPFYLHAKAAGYIYQAVLRRAIMRELGLDWGVVKNGHADLAAIGRAVIEHFSQRRAEIVQEMARHGTSSAKAAEVAAYRTRDAKDYGVDEDVRREEWIARGAEFELSPSSIGEMIEAAQPRAERPIQPSDLETALSKLEATRSHFDRRDLLCALANELPEGAEVDALTSAVDQVLESDRVIQLNEAANPIAPTYFSTPRLWELEQRFVKLARDGKDAGAAVVDPDLLAAVLDRHTYLGEDQREMVTRLLTGGERIVPVGALPGTGKTTALAAACEGWIAAGHPVRGVATARSASIELEDAGVPATSIAALRIEVEGWEGIGARPLRKGTVILLDESTTASTPDAAAIAEMVQRCGGKLVEVGDIGQIGAVGPGGTFGHLTKEIEPSMLSTIRRQRRDVDRRIVELAHEVRGSDALDLMRAERQLVIADTLPEALDALVLDWHRAHACGEDAVMIARRNRDVDELNARARQLLSEEGMLSADVELEVGAESFAVGDRILTRVNTAHVSNRERWEITALDTRLQEIEVRRIGGDERTATLHAEYLAQRTKNAEPAIQHAYAMTTFATQGKTFDSAFALLDAGASQEEFVVNVSRTRGPTIAYGVAATELTDPELGPGIRAIEDEAHELRRSAERPEDEFAALELSMREGLAELDLAELLARRSHLDAQLQPERPSTNDDRIAALEERIAEVTQQLAEDVDAQRALQSQRRADPEELTRAEGKIELGHQQLGRLQAQHDELVQKQSAEAQVEPNHELRLERALIDNRLRVLQRREIGVERLAPTPMIENALGARPSEPERAALWNEGVHLIYSHRYSTANPIRRGDPLGPEPIHGSAAHAERLAVQHRLQEIQTELGVEVTQTRSIDQGLSIEM